MSLTSKELNYLVWRYLQESGNELAAYALEQKNTFDNKDIVQKVQPGCLVELVQKGILYTLAEDTALLGNLHREDSKLGLALTLFGALLENERQAIEAQSHDTKQPQLDSNSITVETQSEITKTIGANGQQHKDNDKDANDAKIDTEMEPAADLELLEPSLESKGGPLQEPIQPEFSTKSIKPIILFASSIVSDWHLQSDVFAYGTENLTAVIVALSNDLIAESVVLMHPVISASAKEINLVSWSPAGNIIVTGSINGELRAWSPDGKLRNVSNTGLSEKNADAAMICQLIWSPSGQNIVTVDLNNQVCIWDGHTLALINQLVPAQVGQPVVAAWLDDHKLALSTVKNGIKIVALLGSSLRTVGLLTGHLYPISILKFSNKSKLLASCSDFDYVIKIWRGNQNQHLPELSGHLAPVLSLEWLNETELVSVSLDGVINVWNIEESKPIKLSSLLKKEGFKFEEDAVELGDKVFAATVSSDAHWLALGDNSGSVTVWDLKSSKVVCLGVFSGTGTADSGICDITWSKGNKICVDYTGQDSVILKWEK